MPMVELATRAMLGEKLRDMGYGTGLYRTPPYVAVKVPVFSFEKLVDVDTHLGPEMKSTGEVLGIGKSLDEALYKGLVAAGYNTTKRGGVLITVRDIDKFEIVDTAKRFVELALNCTRPKEAQSVRKAGIEVETANKIHESDDNVITLLKAGRSAISSPHPQKAEFRPATASESAAKRWNWQSPALPQSTPQTRSQTACAAGTVNTAPSLWTSTICAATT